MSLWICHNYRRFLTPWIWFYFSASTELSGWMRYDGYYLPGHTTKILPYAASDMDCWESCLQETNFLCLALAYAARGNRTCFLYDTKALFHYAYWTSAVEMTYYEFCQNGNTRCTQWSPNIYVISHIIQQESLKPLNATEKSVSTWHISIYVYFYIINITHIMSFVNIYPVLFLYPTLVTNQWVRQLNLVAVRYFSRSGSILF